MKNKTWIQWFAFATVVILFNKAIGDFDSILIAINAIFKVIRPFVFAFIISYFIYPIVKYTQKKLFRNKTEKVGYRLSILMVYILLILIILLLGVWLIPQIVVSLTNFINFGIPSLGKEMMIMWQKIQTEFTFLNNINLNDTITSFVTSDYLSSFLGQFFGFTGFVYSLFMGIIISIYGLLEKDNLFALCRKICLLWLDVNQVNLLSNYVKKLNNLFLKFFFGKMIDSSIVALLATILFYFLNVPSFWVMACILGFTNMIPYFGPFIGAVPVVLFTAIVSGSLFDAFGVAVAILILQQFDGLYLEPKILGETVGITPFWIIVSITLGGALFGFIGLLICVPITAMIQLLFNDYLNYKTRIRKEKLKESIIE